jgi:putative endonuclease
VIDALDSSTWRDYVVVMNEWCVYLLECNDAGKTIYTGITNDLEARIATHNAGSGAKYTQSRTPVKLLKSFVVADKSQALKIEYQVKKLTRQQKLDLRDIEGLAEVSHHLKE